MKTLTEQSNEVYTNKDYDLYHLVEKVAHQFGTQVYGKKTRVGLTQETCEAIDELVAYIKLTY